MEQYIERRPKKISEKTLEQKSTNQWRDLILKNLGRKKIKRNKRPDDDVSVISSGRSCISTTSKVARALKMRFPKRNPKHDDAFTNRPDLTQILHFSPPVPLAAPQKNPSTAGSSPSQVVSPQQPTPILRKERKGKRQMTVSGTSVSDTSSVRISKRTLKKQKKSTHQLLRKYRIRRDVRLIFPYRTQHFLGKCLHGTPMRG